MASSSAAAESSSNGGDDLLTGDLGKNDYDWLLTPPGSPPAPSYHYHSPENGESLLADSTALPNLVRSLAAIKTSRQQAASSKPDLITTKIKDSSSFLQRNNGWNAAARSTSNGPIFSTINGKKPSSSSSLASASVPGSRPLSRSSTPTKRTPNTGIVPSRPTTPTSRSNQKQPSTTFTSSRPTTPTMRTRTMDSSLARTSNGNSSMSACIHSSTSTTNTSATTLSSRASSRPSTPSKRPSTPQSTVQMIRSSSVNKGRPLPSRSMPSSRSTSPNGKVPAQHSAATWQQLSALPGFALEPPPNLRTTTTTTTSRPSSNLRGSYSSPLENHSNPTASTMSRSDGHDLITSRRASDGHDLITSRRASDSHDLLMPHRESDGFNLTAEQSPDVRDLMPRHSSYGHDLTSQLISDGHALTPQRTSDGHNLVTRHVLDGPNLTNRRGFASPARIRSSTSIIPSGSTLDRSNSGGSSLFMSRSSSIKVEKSPNSTTKTIDKMIQSRRPIASTSSFNYPETMSRGGLMSQMKASTGVGKPASPTASSRDVAGLTRSSPKKPIDFSWNKEIRQSTSNGLHSLVSNVPTSTLYSVRRHHPGTRELTSQPNHVISCSRDSTSTHDASLEYGMVNSSITHDLELNSDLGEEFMMGEFSSGKLLASPMSQGESFSSLVKDSRVNNWLGSPEMHRDEGPEVNSGKAAHNKLELITHNEPEITAHAESPSIMCRHGSVASTCDLCMVKLRLQRLNEKCKASLTASFQASNEYSWKSSLSSGTLSARQH